MPDVNNIDYSAEDGYRLDPLDLGRQISNIEYDAFEIVITPLVDPMPFPITKRYFLDFRNSDIGLAPTFTFFQLTPSFTVASPAAPVGGIIEKSNGRYYFDWIWLTKTDADIVFQVDGGASIPTEEVRYIKGTISPRDVYIDEPTSQVVDDVWDDAVDRAVSTKGQYVETIGLPADNSAQATLFGKTLLYKESIRGDTAGTSDGNDVEQVYDAVAAVQTDLTTANTALTDIKGAGFVTGTDSLKIISDNVDAINVETDAASIANAVWDAATAGNIGGGTMGGLVNTAASGSAPSAAVVAAAVWDEVAASHVAVGSFGKLEADTKVAVDAINIETDAASIAAAVWDTTLTSHVTTGTFGQTLQLEDSGAAQAGATSTELKLRAGASAVTDFYKNGLVAITSGTGVGQSRSITGYDGTTKIATVDRAWGTPLPIAGSIYAVFPAAPSSSLTVLGIADAVWDEPIAAHTLLGSTGEKLNAGSAATPYVQFAANGDTVLPVILQVASPKHTQVRVTFSEAVVMTAAANGALNLTNYSIPGLTLTAVVALTSQQVMLTTSAQTPNFLYDLTVTNIEDLQGNPIA
jgi:hypothetical protein